MTYDVIYQSIIAFFVLFILARILGKRQVAQLTFFDYITGLTLGNIAAAWSLDEVRTIHASLALVLWGILSIVLAYTQKKSYRARTVLDGTPIALIENGKINEQNLSKVHMSTDELLMLLRQKDVFKVSDAEYAVFENNGSLSVMKKSELQPLTPKDAGVTVPAAGVPQILVIDGNIMDKSLKRLGYTQEWLDGEIMKQGARTYDDVFFAQIDGSGSVYVDLRNDATYAPRVKMKPLLAATLKKLEADMEIFALETESESAKKSYTEMANKLDNLIQDVLPYLKE